MESDDEDELGLEQTFDYRADSNDEEQLDTEDGAANPQSDTNHQGKDTLSKKPRGRPKGYRKPRTPSPPRHLPAFHHYFFQTRPRGGQTSNNTLSSLSLISHEDYFKSIKAYTDNHESEKRFLRSIHARSFDQWVFELSQAFNICVYGWGSKQGVLNAFAHHYASEFTSRKIVVINGFNSALTVRDILDTVASTIPSLMPSKPPSHPPDFLTAIFAALSSSPELRILLIVNSIDGSSLRRPATQSLLARLASSHHFHLVASADNPQFPLMWSHGLLTQFNWVFHDCTTFQSYDIEIDAGGHSSVVDEVNALIGRSGRKLQEREGVMYVLRSLTANARNLYALLLNELLALGATEDEEDHQLDDGDEDPNEENLSRDPDMQLDLPEPRQATSKNRMANAVKSTIPTHSLYTRAVSQLITTNEINYRALLKEFYDHEMITSRRDAFGSEVLGVPFRKDEMETILADLIGEG